MNTVEVRRNYLKHCFSREYYRWKDRFVDDRMIYCNTYEMLEEALNAMEPVENTLIKCGFNRVFAEMTNEMEDIKHRFVSVWEG